MLLMWAGDSLTDILHEDCQCVVVVRWTGQLPLRLPYATSLNEPLITIVSELVNLQKFTVHSKNRNCIIAESVAVDKAKKKMLLLQFTSLLVQFH